MRTPFITSRRGRRLGALTTLAVATGVSLSVTATAGPARQTATPAAAPAATTGGVPADAAQLIAEATEVYRAHPAVATRADQAQATTAPAAQPATAGGQDSAAAQRNDRNTHPKPDEKLPWTVGFDKEKTDPTDAEIASGQLHLGGFGIAPTRASTGQLVDADGTPLDLYARAMSITDAQGHTMLLADLENQGTFAAYKQGPYGISDIRQAVSDATHVPVDMIVVNSDHSHSGPDLIGLWGGVPISYLQRVHDQTVLALETAFARRTPARLLVGTQTPVIPTPDVGGYIPGTATPGEDMVHSQFSQDTQTNYPDQLVDTQLRVLQAVDRHGKRLGTLINYSAHADVMGSSNLLYSADWPGTVATATEKALAEPVAVTMVADVGRSQPPRPHSDPSCDAAGHPTCNVDQLDTYTRLLTPWVLQAVDTAVAVKDPGAGISGGETLVRESATNPALLGVSYTGDVPVRGYGAYRSSTTPYLAGTVIGSFVSAHRIGDILLTAAPGEAYPDIRDGVDTEVSGMQATFTFGLANDQLGYLIAPTSEYGWITTSNVGNDNSLFNVAAQFGDHVMCTQVNLAEMVGFAATGDAQPYGPDAPAPPCAALTASDAVPVGPSPQPPWPFGDGTALPSPFPQ